jgi:hypothetical protein
VGCRGRQRHRKQQRKGKKSHRCVPDENRARKVQQAELRGTPGVFRHKALQALSLLRPPLSLFILFGL